MNTQDDGRPRPDPTLAKECDPPLTRRATLRRAASLVLNGGLVTAGAGCSQLGARSARSSAHRSRSAGRPFLEFPELPYDLNGARIACTVLREGRRGAFQMLVDETVNAATSPGRFKLSSAFTGIGMMAVMHFDNVQTHASSSWGFLRYYETALSLLLTDTSLQHTSQFIFNPIMILDDAYALIAGREIYGFPKMLGKFQSTGFPEGGDAADHPLERATSEVSVYGFSSTSAQEQAGWRPVMATSVTPTGIPFINRHEWSPDRFLNSISPPLPLIDWNPIKTFLNNSLQGLYLKQFPACGDLSQSCYCSVVRAPYHTKRVKQIRFGTGSVVFQNPASYPLARLLGYAPGATATGAGFVADTDWELEAGYEI